MKLRILGSSGAEFPGYNPPAFLVDQSLLLDGGTIGSRLTENEQWKLRHIAITHSHLDHIKGIPFLADNIIIKNKMHGITLYGIRETLSSLKENLLNDKLWPDFTKISAAIDPVLTLRKIKPGEPFTVGQYILTAFRVNHTVPAVGYIVEDAKKRRLLYTGDTGPTEEIWKAAENINSVIVETSFPNALEELALKTGHLTAGLLKLELAKMKTPPERILVTHPKPQYIGRIKKEIASIKTAAIEMLEDGRIYDV